MGAVLPTSMRLARPASVSFSDGRMEAAGTGEEEGEFGALATAAAVWCVQKAGRFLGSSRGPERRTTLLPCFSESESTARSLVPRVCDDTPMRHRAGFKRDGEGGKAAPAA